jgi:hypothetical protein
MTYFLPKLATDRRLDAPFCRGSAGHDVCVCGVADPGHGVASRRDSPYRVVARTEPNIRTTVSPPCTTTQNIVAKGLCQMGETLSSLVVLVGNV